MTNFEDIFKKIGMIKEGHFLLASGLHSGIYFEKFRLLEHPEYLSIFTNKIAEYFKDEDFETVAGPTTGGIVIAYEVAKILDKRCIFAEKTEQGRDFLRGYKIKKGEKILIVDDVFTTGSSIKDVIAAVKNRGAIVTGIGIIVDRSDPALIHKCGADFGIPFFAVYKKIVKNYTPDNCPFCKKGIKLVKLGGK